MNAKDRARFDRSFERGDGCWEWRKAFYPRVRGMQSGYGLFCHGGSHCGAHRAAWEIVYGPIPDGLYVLHRCDNPRCVRPDHLFLGTQADNVQDKVAKGRARGARRGEGNHRAKLTEALVLEIRRRAKSESQKGIAESVGVSASLVSMIVSRERWGWLP